jgi:hypothetical protein
MPADVEQQLSALGKFWNETVAHVETSEIVSDRTARSRHSVIGIDGIAAAPTADRPPGISQSTEEEVTMIDLETPSQTGEHHKGPKRVIIAGLLAAAAVISIAIVAIRRDDPESPANQPTPTVTVPPTTPPQALFGASRGQLAPGTYFVDEVDGTPTTRILVTVGEGWGSDGAWSIGKGDGQLVTFSRPDKVFLDACHPGDGYHPGPLTTLDGLVTALSEQGGWIDVTTPSDISIDGYSGRAFQRKTPADFSACTSPVPFPDFPSWENGEFGDRGWSYYPPGDTETVWVLDLDGTVIILETRLNAGQPAEAHAELAAVLDSIRIDPV